jgi:ethanolamine ammonia-lyase small subunit
MTSEDSSLSAASGTWAKLRAHTPARIGLHRSGVSLTTNSVIELRAAHAAARDAVWAPMDVPALGDALMAIGSPSIEVASRADDRKNFLMRPDLGRTLEPGSVERLAERKGAYDLAVVVADGLSAKAAQLHAAPVLEALIPALREGWRLAPPVIAEQARVALGDEIALALGATGVLILIGERPGLSATDSLGAYLTWGVKLGLTDANRNCVSNIRPRGVSYKGAARQIAYLLGAARKSGSSGVALKNRADEALGPSE